MRFFRSPLFVFVFLVALALPQAMAFVSQFTQGFLPFVSNPQRVTLSWDMFSNPVDRCVVKWSSPLQIGPHLISSLRDVELPLEWDIILDDARVYRSMSQELCKAFAIAPTQAQVHCFLNNGTETQDAFQCR